MSRFRFVADHRHTYGVKRLCEVLQIARSSFYAWLDGQPRRAQRATADAELAERIRVVHQRDKTQGAPRITAELNDGAPPVARVNHKRVARVMREHGIAGLRLRRRVRTTVPEPADQKVPDLLNRDFTADAANQRYVGDITYLPLADGANLYLATVIDCFSRRLAGWAIAEHMRTELVADALTAARDTRGSLAGAVFHSDHGAQYTSKDFAQLCASLGVTQSMGAVGTSADNALAESFNATLKRETLPGRARLAGRGDLPPRGVRMGQPLQHPPSPLLLRTTGPNRLRAAAHRYAAARWLIDPRRVRERPVDRRRSGGVVGDQDDLVEPEPGDHGVEVAGLVVRGVRVAGRLVRFPPAEEVEGDHPVAGEEGQCPVVEVLVVGEAVHQHDRRRLARIVPDPDPVSARPTPRRR